MNDYIRKILVKAESAASLGALNGKSYQDVILYAASDEIARIDHEKKCAYAEVESLKAKIKELEQRSTMRTRLNLFRNIKFLKIKN